MLVLQGLPERSRKRDVLPAWLEEIANVLVERNIFPSHLPPNHVLINQYQPGEGIMHHTDGPMYHDVVVILSFGAPALMSFRPRQSPDQIGSENNNVFDFENNNDQQKPPADSSFNILLRSNSMLYFSNDAYTSHMHGIDTWDPCRCESWSESFNMHVSFMGDVFGKTVCTHSFEDTPPHLPEGDGCETESGVRTSLTIRHMF